MVYVFGSHPVRDFKTWKPFFDQDEERRKKNGVHLVKLFQADGNPNEVYFLFSAPSKEQFMTLMAGLGDIMEKSGVLAPPKPTFLVEV